MPIKFRNSNQTVSDNYEVLCGDYYVKHPLEAISLFGFPFNPKTYDIRVLKNQEIECGIPRQIDILVVLTNKDTKQESFFLIECKNTPVELQTLSQMVILPGSSQIQGMCYLTSKTCTSSIDETFKWFSSELKDVKYITCVYKPIEYFTYIPPKDHIDEDLENMSLEAWVNSGCSYTWNDVVEGYRVDRFRYENNRSYIVEIDFEYDYQKEYYEITSFYSPNKKYVGKYDRGEFFLEQGKTYVGSGLYEYFLLLKMKSFSNKKEEILVLGKWELSFY